METDSWFVELSVLGRICAATTQTSKYTSNEMMEKIFCFCFSFSLSHFLFSINVCFSYKYWMSEQKCLDHATHRRRIEKCISLCEYLCAPPIPTKWNNESTKKTIFETITFKCARTRSPYSRYIRSQLQSGLLCCYICKRSPNALENQINSVFDLPLVGLINAYR